MNILITGCSGYIGSNLIELLKSRYPKATLIGLDSLLFGNLIHYSKVMPEFYLDHLIVKDLRDVDDDAFSIGKFKIDIAIHLGAISNDPIGDKFNKITEDVNYWSTINLAKILKKNGCKKFIFASSASVYGFSDKLCTESSKINPLTQYAISKANSELGLQELSSNNFQVVVFRFATACGWSPRFRTDVVLNNFITNSIINGNITLNSAGNATRPLITVDDMCKSVFFAIDHEFENFSIYNVCDLNWNFKISYLAEIVSQIVGTKIIKLESNKVDARSYALDSTKFNTLIKNSFFEQSIENVVNDMYEKIKNVLNQENKYIGSLVRLNCIESFQSNGVLNSEVRRTI